MKQFVLDILLPYSAHRGAKLLFSFHCVRMKKLFPFHLRLFQHFALCGINVRHNLKLIFTDVNYNKRETQKNYKIKAIEISSLVLNVTCHEYVTYEL